VDIDEAGGVMQADNMRVWMTTGATGGSVMHRGKVCADSKEGQGQGWR